MLDSPGCSNTLQTLASLSVPQPALFSSEPCLQGLSGRGLLKVSMKKAPRSAREPVFPEIALTHLQVPNIAAMSSVIRCCMYRPIRTN